MPLLLNALRAALTARYDVRSEIGRGAMASVFLANDLQSGNLVAVKVVRPELTAMLGPVRFHREIEVLKRLRHTRIVPLLDSGDEGGFMFLVMPFVAGENLRSRLGRVGALSIESTLAVAADVAAALDYAHGEGVIHRDIKPENILLTAAASDGGVSDADRAVVCDFGLARALDRASLEPISSSGLVLGTPTYMSPEQALAEPDLGPTTDVYALGCVVYEMLTGEPPFTGASAQAIIARQVSEPPKAIRTVRPEVTREMELAILAALAKAPQARPDSGAQFIRLMTGAD